MLGDKFTPLHESIIKNICDSDFMNAYNELGIISIVDKAEHVPDRCTPSRMGDSMAEHMKMVIPKRPRCNNNSNNYGLLVHESQRYLRFNEDSIAFVKCLYRMYE